MKYVPVPFYEGGDFAMGRPCRETVAFINVQGFVQIREEVM
jgi:hypothetical protein